MVYKPEGILITIKKNKICRKMGATRNHDEKNGTDSEKQSKFFLSDAEAKFQLYVDVCMHNCHNQG